MTADKLATVGAAKFSFKSPYKLPDYGIIGFHCAGGVITPTEHIYCEEAPLAAPHKPSVRAMPLQKPVAMRGIRSFLMF